MRRPVIVRREPRAQIDDDLRVDVAADSLLGVVAELLGRAERTGTRREIAQVVLAAAHVDEAVGLLRTIQPAPNPCELAVRGSTMRRARRPCRPLLRAGRPHPAHAVGT
jgi:hypothetical protein